MGLKDVDSIQRPLELWESHGLVGDDVKHKIDAFGMPNTQNPIEAGDTEGKVEFVDRKLAQDSPQKPFKADNDSRAFSRGPQFAALDNSG
jgi:hypothetical protein